MGDVRKILGQCSPPASTDTVLYSCPTSAVLSTIFVCNRNSAAETFRLWVRRGGEDTAVRQYIYYDVSIPRNDTFSVTAGITLSSNDDIYVRSSATTLSFSAFGVEASA